VSSRASIRSRRSSQRAIRRAAVGQELLAVSECGAEDGLVVMVSRIKALSGQKPGELTLGLTTLEIVRFTFPFTPSHTQP
jgi:hypothetical protein